MAELLKHIYNASFFDTYSDALQEVIPSFDKITFMTSFTTPHWESLELKQRMAYLAHITDKLLPDVYIDKISSIFQLIATLRKRGVRDQNLEYIFLADIIAEHGLDDLKTSIFAIEYITQFVSFEFAGRAFIIRYPKEMMHQMIRWASHTNEYVRRYASEGCRPRLPWGLQLKILIDDPKPALPILEQLINDPSLYVRKSVANHLNDISKDHPELITDFIKKWKGTSDHTDWILRQAARTLLKKGDTTILHIFGTPRHTPFQLEGFQLYQSQITTNDKLTFSFLLTNQNDQDALFRIEYIIWYIKSGGHHIKKIFKIAERSMSPQQTQKFIKQHRFQDLTTRRHYSGLHKISIVINGNESTPLNFELKM